MILKNQMLDKVREQSFFVGMSVWERFAVLFLFFLIVIGTGIFNLSHNRMDLVLLYFAFLIYMGVLAIPFLFYRSNWGWFHPLILIVLWHEVVHGVFPRLGLYANGLDYHRALSGMGAEELNIIVVQGLLLTSLALICMYFSFFCIGKIHVPRLSISDPKFLFPKVLIIGGISGFAFLYLISEAGGLGQLMLQRGLPSDMRIGAKIGGHLHFIVGLLKTACLVWLSLRPWEIKNPQFISLFVFALFIDFAATGSRGGLVMPIILAVVIWSIYYKKIPYAKILLLGIIAFLAIGILGEFRADTRSVNTLSDVNIESGLIEGVSKGINAWYVRSSENYGLYGILGKVPEDVDLLAGESYLSIPVAPIPSALLPFEKPEAGGKLASTYIYGNPLSAVPPGSVGEAFWNFHVPGVVIVFLIWGLFLKFITCFYEFNFKNSGFIIIYVLTIFNLQPHSPSFYDWLHAIIPVIAIILFFCGLPRKVRNSE